MPAQYTDITILLDRSGSMEAIRNTMESALDELLAEHKKVPSTRVSLIQFDGYNAQEEVYIDRPVTEAPRTELVPRGTTPLRDALCHAINRAGLRLAAKPEPERPDQVLFVIITDGLENASLVYTHEDVRTRIQRQTDIYKWTFIYLGANQNAIKEASSLGINPAMAAGYAANSVGTRQAVHAVIANSANYVGQQVNRGSSRTLAFSDEQRVAAMAPEPDPFVQLPLPADDDDEAVKTP
jgi:uncharacterized protein YegL